MEVKSSCSENHGILQHINYVMHTTLDEVAWVTEALKGLIPAHLSEEDSYAIELGITEVLTNIVQHGYLGQKNGLITVDWKEYINHLEISVSDMGLSIPSGLLEQEISNAFNFDVNNIQELSESGFGLVLVKTVFDKVDYQSVDGVNRICLGKNFPN